jgi:hypothetical protein
MGAIRHHAGSCQKPYKQSDTEEVKRVNATQGITASNSEPCGLPLQKHYEQSYAPLQELHLCNKNAITLQEFYQLETVQTLRVAKQHSPTKSMRTAADN